MATFLRYQQHVVDEAGDVVNGASVEVRDENTGLLATVYDDKTGATGTLSNPLTADADGYVYCYLRPGSYEITATSGAFSRVWEDVQLGNSGLSDFVDDITDLLGHQPTLDGFQTNVKGYHPNSDKGGGKFYWDSDLPRSNHNGGTIISPTSTWDGTTGDLPNFLDGTNETSGGSNGCWVRRFDVLYLSMFGAYSGEIAYSLQAAADWAGAQAEGYVICTDPGEWNWGIQIDWWPKVSFCVIPQSRLVITYDAPDDNTGQPMISDDVNGSGDNVFFGGGEIVGPYEGDLAAAMTAFDAGENLQGVRFRNGTRYRFDELLFDGFSGDCIRLDGTNTTTDPSIITVTRCEFRNAWKGVWCKHGIDEITFLGNKATNLGANFIGIDDLSTGETYGPQPTHIVIADNQGTNLCTHITDSAIGVFGSLYGTITGNTLVDIGDSGGGFNASGIATLTGGNATLGAQFCRGFTIANNTIIRPAGNGINNSGLRDSTISNNTIEDWEGPAAIALSDATGGGAFTEGCENITVSGNRLTSTSGTLNRGVYLTNSNQINNAIVNNPTKGVDNPVDDLSGAGSGNTISYGVSNFVTSNRLPGYKEMKLQSFVFSIQNNGGTLEHRFLSGLFGAQSEYHDKIIGSSSTFTTTPTVDGVTDFANGGGILSGSLYRFILNTLDYSEPEGIGIASIERNTSGTDVNVRLTTRSDDVNGTTRARLALEFYDAATGATFLLDTTNIPAGDSIEVNVMAYVPG